MTLPLTTRTDITLEAVRRVAWEGEGVDARARGARRMDDAHASFMALVEARARARTRAR